MRGNTANDQKLTKTKNGKAGLCDKAENDVKNRSVYFISQILDVTQHVTNLCWKLINKHLQKLDRPKAFKEETHIQERI